MDIRASPNLGPLTVYRIQGNSPCPQSEQSTVYIEQCTGKLFLLPHSLQSTKQFSVGATIVEQG